MSLPKRSTIIIVEAEDQPMLSDEEPATVTLGNVCTKIGSGATPRGGRDVYLQDGPYSLIRSQNVYNDGFRRDGLAYIGEHNADELRNVRVLEDDILLNITGDSVARVCQVPLDVLPARVNQHVLIIRPDRAIIDPQFLRYYLVSPGIQELLLSWAGSGGTRNALTKRMIESLELHIPPLDEQRRIAHILGTLDDKIELNRRMNATLEEMAGREAYLPADVWALFPERLGDDGLPEGWEVGTIAEYYDLTMGQSPPGRSYNDDGDGVPLFQGSADFSFRFPDNRRFCTEPKRFAETDDTLVSVRAPVGAINMAYERCCIGRGVAALRHRSGSSSFTYYSLWAMQEHLQQYEHTGTVFGAINKSQFSELTATEPPQNILEAFSAYALRLDERIRLNTGESRNLAALRDTMLPGLVSGEVRINTAIGGVL